MKMRLKNMEHKNIYEYREDDQDEDNSYEVRNYYDTMYTISLPTEDDYFATQAERTNCKIPVFSDSDDDYDNEQCVSQGLFRGGGIEDQWSNWSTMDVTCDFEDADSFSDVNRFTLDLPVSRKSESTAYGNEHLSYRSSQNEMCCVEDNMADHGSTSPMDLYIYDLPYSVTRSIIVSMDADKSWEALACAIGYSFEKLKLFELEYHRFSGSPTKSILWDWGNSNNTTVKELYYTLKKINRRREMTILKTYIQSVSKDKEDTEENSDSSSSLQSSTLSSSFTSALPLPSQIKIRKSEKFSTAKENSDLNFNLSQLVISNDLPKKSINSMEKDKQYDDKIIPGQEHSQPMHKSNKGQSKSFHTGVSMSGQSGQQGLPTLNSNSNSSPTESSDSSFVTSSIDKDSKNSSYSFLSNFENLNMDAARVMTSQFSYDELANSTNNFSASNLIGEGAFGKVYSGSLRGMRCAIKKLEMDDDDKNTDNQKQLTNEVGSLLKYRHENIVTLYGFAMDGPTLCLIYQHMINGSLEDRLICKGGTQPLNWDQRIRIMCGAANGLRFLHKMGDVPLIHGDIKSANILIDKYYEAKIGDLGQAKHASKGTNTGQITHITRSCANSKMYGTKAYMAPELHRGSTCSMKSDVFAFGVVLLETCTGEKAYDERREPSTCKYITDYFSDISDNVDENEWVEKFRDKKAGKPPQDIVLTIFHLAVTCTHSSKPKRADMNTVVEELEKCQKIWNDVYASIPENNGSALSMNSCHISHTSDGVVSVGNMADNLTPPKKNQLTKKPCSPMEYLQNEHMALPVAFQIQAMYDKQKNGVKPGNKVPVVTEEVKEQNVAEEFSYKSDPKKLAEIEESDRQISNSQESPLSLVQECDPLKLAKLKMFDQRNISDPVKCESDRLTDQMKLQNKDLEKLQIENALNISVVKNDQSLNSAGSGDLTPDSAICDEKSFNNTVATEITHRQSGLPKLTINQNDDVAFNNVQPTYTKYELSPSDYGTASYPHMTYLAQHELNRISNENGVSHGFSSQNSHTNQMMPNHHPSSICYSSDESGPCTANSSHSLDSSYFGNGTRENARDDDDEDDDGGKKASRKEQLALITEDADGRMKSKMEELIKAFNDYDEGNDDAEEDEYSEDDAQNE